MKAAVLGSPIAHSLSPALHRAAYAKLGLDDWTYEAVECVGEWGLQTFVRSRGPDWAGLSLTMPLKRLVLPMLDYVDPTASVTGGANTVVFCPDGRYGHNTDVQGIIEVLTRAGARTPDSVTILGGGATACSALAALAALGATGADVVVRNASRAADLLTVAEHLDLRVRLLSFAELDAVAPVSGLLISTVPAGAADGYAERIRATGRGPAVVLDAVYAPWPSPLAAVAAATGAVVASGFDMLLHQAAAQVVLMTGKLAPLAAMRAAGEAALALQVAAASAVP